MKKNLLLLFLALSWSVCASAVAAVNASYTPKPGAPERKQILDAVRDALRISNLFKVDSLVVTKNSARFSGTVVGAAKSNAKQVVHAVIQKDSSGTWRVVEVNSPPTLAIKPNVETPERAKVEEPVPPKATQPPKPEEAEPVPSDEELLALKPVEEPPPIRDEIPVETPPAPAPRPLPAFSGEPPYTPKPESLERKKILDAIRKALRTSSQFDVLYLKAKNDAAYFAGTTLSGGGAGKPEVGRVRALIEKQDNGAWKVVEIWTLSVENAKADERDAFNRRVQKRLKADGALDVFFEEDS